jgi:transglutaminase-like putative cysteine protease
MSQRHPYAVVAGVATLMAAFPLTTVFKSYTWVVYAAFAVAAVVGAAMLVRAARGPVWTQVLAMMGALLVYLTVIFPSGSEFFVLIPSGATFVHFNDMLVAAGSLIRTEAAPVPDLPGLLLLTTAGIGLMAVLVDLAAVGLRRPALAGLPMLALYSVPVAILPTSVPALTFVVASAGYLWLLVSDSVDRVRRFGRRFTGEGRDVELWEPSPLSAAGRRLGVVGVVAAMVLPIAIPSMGPGLLTKLNGPGSGAGIGPGTGPAPLAVNLNAVITDSLNRDKTTEMVTVSTNDPSPFYLKFGVADKVTNAGFENQAPTGGTPLNRPFTGPPASTAGTASPKYQAQITVTGLDMPLAPAYQTITGIQGLDNAWSYDDSTGQIFGRGDTTILGRKYTIEFQHVTYTPQALRSAAPIDERETGLRDLINVPPNSDITKLVDTLTAGKTTEYDRVRALYEFFKPDNGFKYSLTVPPGASGLPVLDFINSKQGFCVQYAAALTWLARVAHIPARVAFGFTRGPVIAQGVAHLTNYNLHAWTEIFFPGFGWVPFDATPSGSIAGSAPTPWSPDLSNPTTNDGGDDLGLPPKDTGANPTPTPGPTGVRAVAPAPASLLTRPWFLGGVAALVLLLLVSLAPAVRRRVLRQRRRARAAALPMPRGEVVAAGQLRPPVDRELIDDPAAVPIARLDAHAAWSELIDTLVDFDVAVDLAETPRATADRLRELPAFAPTAQDAAVLIARAEERARYARTPMRSDGLDPAVRTVRSALAQRATGRQRFLAAVMPRSVTLRWRATWIGWVNRSIRTGARIRGGLAVVNPRRLLASRAAR